MIHAKQQPSEVKEDDDPDRSRPTPSSEEVRSRFLQFVGRYKRYIIIAAIANISTVIMAMTPPLFSKVIIDEAIPGRNAVLLVGLALGIVVIYAVRAVIGYGHDFLFNYVGQRVVFDLRRALFHHLQLLHLSFYEKERTASLVNRVIHDAAAVQQFVNTAFSTLANSCVALVIGVSIMMFLNWKLTCLCLLSLPIYFLIIHRFRKTLRVANREVKERQSQLAGSLGETFAGIRVVKSFAQEDHERRRFVLRIKDNFVGEFELPLLGSRMRVSLGFITVTVTALVWIVNAFYVFNGSISIGSYVAYNAYLNTLFAPLDQLSSLILTSTNARTSFERILSVLNIHPDVREDDNPVELKEIKGHVEFRNVWFSYTEEKPAIRDFSLDVKPGEVIALVGHSGCGKSTLMSLLTRFYDVDEGAICIDGVDIRRLKYDLYRQQVGIVLQENYLFSGTIDENIRYGRPEATDEEVREAARLANALEFIERLPKGFQSEVGQAGVTLSGGQRQRLAIARAILKNPRILIFDEATSALDNESEALIQNSLDSLMKGKTVFIIAHRLSTIVKAHRIVVMHQGQIVEIGKHEELLAKGGYYARLHNPKTHPGDEPKAGTEDKPRSHAVLAAAV